MLKSLLNVLAVVAALAAPMPVLAQTQGEITMSTPTTSGHVAVNGVELYYEKHGEGSPVLMLHGGVNPSEMFGAPLAAMAETHEAIAVHLRGHGLSSDADTPWSYEQMADDVDALLGELGIDTIDVMGYSTGGGVALQLAIRHPERVGKLVVVSRNIKDTGNYPEVQAAFEQMPDNAPMIAGYLSQSPLAALYPAVNWESLMLKTGELNRKSRDWSEDVARITAPTLLIFADADMMYPEHIAEIYRLFGGGTQDAGVDGSLRPTQNQLAIIPHTTHYDLMQVAAGNVTGYAKAFLTE